MSPQALESGPIQSLNCLSYPPDHGGESQDYHFMINLELRSCRRGNAVTDEEAIINIRNPRE